MASSRTWLALALLAVGALAQGQKIEYHATYEEALEAAKERQQLVMVIIVSPTCGYCKKLKEEVLTSGPIVKLVGRCFAPVLVDMGEVQAGRQKLPDPVKAKYLQGNQLKIPGVPLVVFVDSKGKLVEKLFELTVDQAGTKKWFDALPGYQPPERYHTLLKMVSEKVTKAGPPKKRRDVARAMRRGQEALERKDYRTAIAALNAVVEDGPPGEERDLASRLLAEVDQKALVKLEDGKALEAEEKLGSAIRAYRECVHGFHGSKSAEQATARLKALRDDADLRKRLHDYMANQLVAKAERAMKRGQYSVAAEDLDRLLERYGDADAADKAKGLRKKLDSDPDIKAEIREASVRSGAERLLRLAAGYQRNKMLEKALATYKQVVQKYPKTKYAATAEEHIATLRAEIEQ